MVRIFIYSVLATTLFVSEACSAIIYTNPADQHVLGSWEFSDTDAVLVHPMTFPIDLNRDGISDVSVTHHYLRGDGVLDKNAFDLLQAAQLGQRETASLLKEIRQIALSSANEGVNDFDALLSNQSSIESKLERIDRIANHTVYGDRVLLNGDSGFQGLASSSSVQVLNVDGTTFAGSHAVTIATAAERASFVTNLAALPILLGQDETLTINGVKVDLFEGMTRAQVRDRVNSFTDYTGVTAHIASSGLDAGTLRLQTTTFGSASEIAIISNVAAGMQGSTSIGTTETVAAGVDIVATIGGHQFNGQGNVVTADNGLARGLTIAVLSNDIDDAITAVGNLGVVMVSNESLSFAVGPPHPNVDFTLRSLHSSSLGLGVVGNVFANLSEINVTSNYLALNSLEIVDAAVDTVRIERSHIEHVLDDFFFPFGEAEIEGIGLAEIAVDGDGIGLLATGTPIGPTSRFSDVPLTLNSLTFNDRDSAFFGVRLQVDDQFHYGWIRAETAEDDSLIIRDFALESTPNKTIRAGFVPEPKTRELLLTAVFALGVFGRVLRRDGRLIQR
ncbi:MAG: hypothetical protein KDB27_15285 [Planctomycetales bacterium]|nr:hypothetical protein [Planctomycetales bacterium]